MPNSNQEKQDQRTNSGMEDSNAMTIEFLRARLLSERSVSRISRQRADELARRVAELEEQLKMVSIQRRKAEQATVDVLAILENNGISDISEASDSSSDHETPCKSNVGNNKNFNKEEENSVDSNLRRNESEELSGSEYDFCPVPQRGLVWKGCKGIKQSLEKHKDYYLRRRSSFASISSSPKDCVGRSCRRIKRHESNSVVEELKTDSINVDLQENRTTKSLEVGSRSEILRGSDAQEDQCLGEGSDSGCLENENNVTNSNVDLDEHEGDKDMEKALQHQAQLIGRYEEMEKAQREWEERFRENNSSTPDSCDPGNQSDVTEEREEIKGRTQCVAGTLNSEVQEAKSEVNASNELSKTQSNIFLPPSHGDMRCLVDQKGSSAPASESLPQDYAPSVSKEKQNQERKDANHFPPSHSSHNHLQTHASPGNLSSRVGSSDTSSTAHRAEVTGSPAKQYALVPHKTSAGFNEVLEALKRARLSLDQKIGCKPLAEIGSVGKAVESSLPTAKVWDRVEIPVGCSGLFRVPTDYAMEATKANFSVSGAEPNLAKYNSITGLGVTADDQIVSNSFLDTGSTFSADNFLATCDQFLTRPSIDTRSSQSTEHRFLPSLHTASQLRMSTHTPSFDGNLDAGLPSSRQYAYPGFSFYSDQMSRVPSNERFSTFVPSRPVEMHPTFDGSPLSSQYAYPTFSTYPSHMPRIPVKEGFSTFQTRRADGVPPAHHTPFYDDRTRPNMYR